VDLSLAQASADRATIDRLRRVVNTENYRKLPKTKSFAKNTENYFIDNDK